MNSPVRIAIAGAGFWARFQIAAWHEVGGVEIVGIANRTPASAQQLAHEFAIPYVNTSVDEMLEETKPDVLDIITAVEAHRPNVESAARHGVAAICQKPLSTTLEAARAMIQAADNAGIPLLVHENFRWQTTIRAIKQELETGNIGTPFRAQINFCSAFPVFDNQPFLRDLEQFLVTDVGAHILDIARFLFGEPTSIYCRTSQVNEGIAGEDVATVVLQQGPTTTICAMSFASHLERQPFPQTLAVIEGSRGSIQVAEDYWIRTTVADRTISRRVPPPRYAWADPAYEIVHASIVPCNAHLLAALKDGQPAETTGEDNLRTLNLVFKAYESAASGNALSLSPQERQQSLTARVSARYWQGPGG